VTTPNHDRWADDEARGRVARDTGAYRTGLLWLGFLLAGLVAAAVVGYLVYAAFDGWFARIATEQGGVSRGPPPRSTRRRGPGGRRRRRPPAPG
jgi:hypothetical protein